MTEPNALAIWMQLNPEPRDVGFNVGGIDKSECVPLAYLGDGLFLASYPATAQFLLMSDDSWESAGFIEDARAWVAECPNPVIMNEFQGVTETSETVV